MFGFCFCVGSVVVSVLAVSCFCVHVYVASMFFYVSHFLLCYFYVVCMLFVCCLYVVLTLFKFTRKIYLF